MGNQVKNTLKKAGKLALRAVKALLAPVAIILGIVIFIIILISSFVYYITVDDGTYDDDDWTSPGFATAQNTKSATVSQDGKLGTSYTAQELWDKMIEEGSRVDEYLDSPEELAKLMNAEIVTQYPDTRENPDEEINWDEVLKTDSKEMQGIIKLKRNLIQDNSNITTNQLQSLREDYETYRNEYLNEHKDEKEEEEKKTSFVMLSDSIIDKIKEDTTDSKYSTRYTLEELFEGQILHEEQKEYWLPILEKKEAREEIRAATDISESSFRKIAEKYNGSNSEKEDKEQSEDEKEKESGLLEFGEWMQEQGYSQIGEEWQQEGASITMTYVDPETFESYLEEYRKTGSEEAKQKALSHFTLEKANAPDGSQTINGVESLDGMLFIGDSITKGLEEAHTQSYWLDEENINALKNTTYRAVVSQHARYWLNNFDQMPDASTVNSVCVLLGVNAPNDIASMKQLIDKLQEKYSGKNIYIQKVFPVGKTCSGYLFSPDEMNSMISTYNDEIESYCSQKENVYFIDTTTGYVTDDGYLNPDKTADGVHFTDYNTWVNNIRSKLIKEEDTGVQGSNNKNEETENKEDSKEDGEQTTESKTSTRRPNFDNVEAWKNPYNGYQYGQCTWFAAGRVYEIYGLDPNGLGNGNQWVDNITAKYPDVFEKSDSPKAGAVFSGVGKNHVGIVIDVQGDQITVQEGNLNASSDSWEWAITECTNGQFGAAANGDWVERTVSLSELSSYYNGVTFANPKVNVEFDTSSTTENSNGYSDGFRTGTQYCIKVATWKETITSYQAGDPTETSNYTNEVIYEMSTTKINYYDMVKNYTMPFDYLWAMMVITDDKDFVFGLADLVYNSNIEITVNDSLNVTTVNKTFNYTKRTVVTERLTTETGTTYSRIDPIEVPVTSYLTTITKTNTVDVGLTRANTWIVDYSKKYKYQGTQTTGSSSVTSEQSDYSKDVTYTETGTDPLGVKAEIEAKSGEKVIGISSKHVVNRINWNTNVSTTIETTKYQAGTSSIREKTTKILKKDVQETDEKDEEKKSEEESENKTQKDENIKEENTTNKNETTEDKNKENNEKNNEENKSKKSDKPLLTVPPKPTKNMSKEAFEKVNEYVTSKGYGGSADKVVDIINEYGNDNDKKEWIPIFETSSIGGALIVLPSGFSSSADLKEKVLNKYEELEGRFNLTIEEKESESNEEETNTPESDEDKENQEEEEKDYVEVTNTEEEDENFEYTEKNFVTLLCTSSNSKAKSNILNVSSWLFEILEKNDSTAGMVDLTKYLLYRATGSERWGVLEFDFSIFDPENFSSVDGIAGNTIEEKVWVALRKMGYSEIATAGAMGNIYYESGGFKPEAIEGGTGEGIGLCQWSFGRKTALMNYAQSKGKDWRDEDIQVEFLVGELTPGGGANGYASYQLMAYNGYVPDQWINATDIATSTTAFCWTFERPASGASLPQRIEAAQNYYDQFKGRPLDSFGSGGTYPVYFQEDSKWGNNPLGNTNIATGGCGFTSMAMAVSGLTGKEVTPADVVAWGGSTYYINNQGASWSLITGAASHYGLKCENLGKNISAAASALQEGKAVVCSQGPGLFTTGGHFILLVGIDGSGAISIHDPSMYNGSDQYKGFNNRKFSQSEIDAAAKNYWALSK